MDVNFSLDHKQTKSAVIADWIGRAQEITVDDTIIQTLQPYDFVLHLCQHLYKEATTYPWIEMKRDMTLYKFCDIYALLQNWPEKNWRHLAEKAVACDLQEPCYYALYATKVLFSLEGQGIENCLLRLAPVKKDIIQMVLSPAEKKEYYYTNQNLVERFFASDRISLLREGEENGSTKYAAP